MAIGHFRVMRLLTHTHTHTTSFCFHTLHTEMALHSQSTKHFQILYVCTHFVDVCLIFNQLRSLFEPFGYPWKIIAHSHMYTRCKCERKRECVCMGLVETKEQLKKKLQILMHFWRHQKILIALATETRMRKHNNDDVNDVVVVVDEDDVAVAAVLAAMIIITSVDAQSQIY